MPSRMIFLNKLDRPGASLRRSIQSLLSNRLHPKPLILTLPVSSFNPEDYSRAVPGLQGIIDLVKWEVWKWDQDGIAIRQHLPGSAKEPNDKHIIPRSHPIYEHALTARMKLLENLAMFSDDLMTHMLDLPSGPMVQIPERMILDCLRTLTLQKEILPVLCGAAVSHKGTDLVLDYAGELLANPVDVTPNAPMDSASTRALAWKVTWDSMKGWVTYVRVYSGQPTCFYLLGVLSHEVTIRDAE